MFQSFSYQSFSQVFVFMLTDTRNTMTNICLPRRASVTWYVKTITSNSKQSGSTICILTSCVAKCDRTHLLDYLIVMSGDVSVTWYAITNTNNSKLSGGNLGIQSSFVTKCDRTQLGDCCSMIWGDASVTWYAETNTSNVRLAGCNIDIQPSFVTQCNRTKLGVMDGGASCC